jgi:hypothetical protein
MLLNKIIIIGILLINIGSCYAWGDETPIVENETSNTIFNPFMNATDPENAFEYSYEREIMNMPFYQGIYTSNNAISVCTSYKIYKQIWDGSSYVQVDNCNVSIETCVNLNYDANKNQYVLPDNYDDVTTNGFLVKKYFQDLINSDSVYCSNWNNSDEIDNPDIFYTEIIVDTGEADNYMGYIYTSLDNRAEKELSKGKIDYGYAEGKGSEGGSNQIYEGINLYKSGEGTDIDSSILSTVFFVLIPLIFIFSVMKLIMKVS